MGRIYTTFFENVSVTAVQDFFELLAATGKPFTVHEIKLGQTSDVGDAAAEILRVQLKRATGSYTSGSGGSTHTPAKHSTNDASAGPTTEINNTTQASAGSGTLTTFLADTFNIAIGWHYLPTPEIRPKFLPAEALLVSLPGAPADALSISGSITFEED